jgi:hypothetical protein
MQLSNQSRVVAITLNACGFLMRGYLKNRKLGSRFVSPVLENRMLYGVAVNIKKQFKMKAINTFYDSNFFRSRLEARWAVFFNYAQIKYQYEPQGFVTEEGCYLPDFFLPDFDCYAEVKPFTGSCMISFIENHSDAGRWAEVGAVKNLLFLLGNPHNRPMPIIARDMFLKDNGSLNIVGGFACDFREVGFHLETKGKNEYDNKKIPYWRFWNAGGDEVFEDLNLFIELANKKRFEHGSNAV